MSKSQSGLGRLKRNWSNASMSAASCSSELISEWDPTPPKDIESTKRERAGLPKHENLTEEEREARAKKRLLTIRNALASMEGVQAQTQPPAPEFSERSSASNQRTTKRPSLDSVEDAPQKKRRELPPSWQDDHLSNSSFSRPISSSTVANANEHRSRYWSNGNGAETGTGQEQRSYPTLPKSNMSSASSQITKVKQVAKVFLSEEQAHILKLVQEGHSVFYTGSAGTGKSVLLREIIKSMKNLHSRTLEAVAVTASTGIAACNIGGVTIHSFAGIGLGHEPAEKLADKVRKNRKALMRWIKTKVLIIDEVSMVDGELFDKLAHIASILRKRPNDPFGGIQLIVTGDFFQLPPVNKMGSQVKFAFEADHWQFIIKKTFKLEKVFRQKDEEFVKMLNEMRTGKLSPRSIAKFKSLSRGIVYNDGLGPTELFPRREDVERSNGQRIGRLPSEEVIFTSLDGGILTDVEQRKKILSNFMAPEKLRLRVDAQVMLIKNVDEQLVNGSMGRVTRFIDPTTYTAETGNDTANGVGVTNAIPKKSGYTSRYPEVEFSLPNGSKRTVLVSQETWKVELPSGETQVSRTQLPLILAWAMSIHKSQGQTLDRVKVDLSRVFEKGQAYVALSRATSLDGLQVLNFDPKKVTVHQKVVDWTNLLEKISGKPTNGPC